MTETSKCVYHPIAPAIDNCDNCESALCGMCANFESTGIYCEQCLKNHESEQLVIAEIEKNKQSKTIPLQTEITEDTFNPPTGGKLDTKLIQIIVIGICTTVMGVQLYLYSRSPDLPQDPFMLQRQQAVTSLVECLTVFSEIGLVLSRGETPGSELRCADSFEPNEIIRNGSEIRIVHPNPQFYDQKAIYVTNQSPVPIATQLGN